MSDTEVRTQGKPQVAGQLQRSCPIQRHDQAAPRGSERSIVSKLDYLTFIHAGKDKQAQAAATLLRAAMQLLSSKFPGGVESIPDDHTATLKDSVPTAAFWELYATQPAGAARAAASQGLLTALAHATPADILQGLGGDDGDAKRALSGLSRLQPAADFKLHTLLLWKRACQDEGHVLTDMLNSSDASSQVRRLCGLPCHTPTARILLQTLFDAALHFRLQRQQKAGA